MGWDIFFAANDRTNLGSKAVEVTASDVSWTLPNEGVLVNTSAGANAFTPGAVVLVRQASKPDAYCYVAKQPSNTSVYLLPINSALDGAGAIGTTYGNTATITSGIKTTTPVYETACSLVVDLTDAPELAYTFLIVCDAAVNHAQANKNVRACLRSMALVDDPLSGNVVGECNLDLTNQGQEYWQFNAVKEVTLQGGQRYEFHLQVCNGSTTGRARMLDGHILAIRVDGWTGYLRSTSNMDGAPTTAATTTDVAHAQVTVAAGGTYVAFVAGLVGHSSATAADRLAQVKLRVAGTAQVSAIIKLPTTTSRVPVGAIAAIAPATGNNVFLTVNNQGASGSASIEQGICVIASLTSLPPWLAQRLNDSQLPSGATITAPDNFTDSATSAAQTIAAGTWIEMMTGGAGIASGTLATDYYQLRPVWAGDYYDDQVGSTPPLEYENDAPARGIMGSPGFSALSVPNTLNFWLWRGTRIAATGSTNVLQSKWRGVSHDVFVATTKFLWLREQEPTVPQVRDYIWTAVEMEHGQIYKSWDPTGTTGLYQRHLDDVLRVGRVLLNGAELPKAAVQTSAPKLLNPGTWGWDPVADMVYVYMPATPSGRTPGDDRETVVVAVEEFVSDRAFTVIDADGEYRPYSPELTDAPTVKSELQVRDSGTEVVASLGDLVLTNATARWDDVAMRENFAGLYATIHRGVRTAGTQNNTLLRDLQVIAKANLDVPEFTKNGKELRLGLFDRILQLRRPLDGDTKLTVWTGVGAAAAPRDYATLPLLFGMALRRVEALRVSSDASSPTQHWFKVATHSVVAFGNVYKASDATTPIVTGYTPTSDDKLAGQFAVKSAGTGGDASFNQDSLWVDVLGGNAAGIQNVGAIFEYLLLNYPLLTDEFSGAPVTTLATANHTSTAAGIAAQVAATTGFSVGDRVKVISQAGASTFYHAVVTQILATPARLFLVPEYRTLDALIGTTFTFGANATVMKCVFPGGLQLTDIARATARLFDRRWRRRYQNGAYVPDCPDINLVLDPTSTVEDAIVKMMRAFGFVFANPVGRIELGVPDADAACLTKNPGFELDLVTSPATSRSVFPWTGENGLTSAVTTSIKASGLQAVEVTRTQTQPGGDFYQNVIVPKGGEYVALTLLVGLRAGDGTAVRLAFTDPSSPLRDTVSDPFDVQSGVWTRISAPFAVPRGAAGIGMVRLIPHFPEGHAPYPPALATAFLGVPTPVAGVTGWLDASNVAVQNGSRLASWPDRVSGNATSSGAQRPRWWRNACFHRPGVVFDDSNDRMQWITVGAAPYTVFVVYAPTTADPVNHRALSGGGANWFMGANVGSGSTLLYHAFTGGATGTGFVGTGIPVEADGAYACSCLVATSNALSEHFVNGVSAGQNTAASQVAPGLINLGWDTTHEAGFCRIVEVIVFNSALSPTARSSVEDYLMRTYGIRSVTLAVDDFQAFPVVALLDQHNSLPFPIQFDPDTFYEAQVSYNVSTQDNTFASYIRVTDSEARGLTTAISQAKNALPNAQRIVVDDLLVTDASSAAGIAAAYAAYFGRPRHKMQFMWDAPTRIPKIGERAFHWQNRVPELADHHPIHLVVQVATSSANAVQISTERQNDFVSDRLTIAASDFPIGLIFMSVSSTCPASGYSEEVVGMRGYYLAGGAAADLAGTVGAVTHRHSVKHGHTVSSHSHTFDIPSQTLGDPEISADVQAYDAFFGPHNYANVASGLEQVGGVHLHNLVSALNGRTTAAAAPASDQPALFTFYGSNNVSWRRVLFCKRIGGSGAFPTDMILGYYGPAAAPPAWALADGGSGRPDLRGLAPRGARSDVSGGTTAIKTATTHVQSNATGGAILDVASPALIRLYQRITIAQGANTYHAVVVQAPGSGGLAADRCMVQSLHEDGDAPDGTSYPATSSTITIDSELPGVSVTIAVHRHQATGSTGTGAIPSHTHTAPHQHLATAQATMPGSSGQVLVEVTPLGAGPISEPAHVHTITPLLPTYSGASGSAGGDITSACVNAPDSYQLPFILPTAGQTVLPVSVVAWSDTVCPDGFEHLDAADNLLIVGAPAGVGAGAATGGHFHTYDAASHTFTHQHAGGAVTLRTDPNADQGLVPDMNQIGNVSTGKFGIMAASPGFPIHTHSLLINNIQNTAATLTATTGQNSGISRGTSSIPVAHTLITCVKV